MRAQAPQHLRRDPEPAAGLRHHRLAHAQRLGQSLVPGERGRQVVERQVGGPVERAIRPGQPRFGRRGLAGRRPDRLRARVGESLAHGLLDHPADEPPVRRQQDVPHELGAGVARVLQRELQPVDPRLRIEPVQAPLVPGEPGDEKDMPERPRRAGLHVHLVADPHGAQLGQPWPVDVGGEPGVRVPVEVDLQVPAALVQRGRRHQPLRAAGGVLPDEERGLAQLVQQPGVAARVRLRPWPG